ncbi:MAG: cytochrome c [Bizionia sp.]|nr:cytochrome c [Bizionia sp.]
MTSKSVSAESKTYNAGKKVYLDNCISCHLPSGKGVPKAFPPLANSDFLENNREASIHAIKYGLSGEIIVNGERYNSVMAPLGLTDKEIADVMNYITNSWGNTNDNEISVEEVSKIQQ